MALSGSEQAVDSLVSSRVRTSRPEVPPEVVFTKVSWARRMFPGSATHPSPSFRLSNCKILRAECSRESGTVFRYRLGGANSIWTETAQRELQFAALAREHIGCR